MDMVMRVMEVFILMFKNIQLMEYKIIIKFIHQHTYPKMRPEVNAELL